MNKMKFSIIILIMSLASSVGLHADNFQNGDLVVRVKSALAVANVAPAVIATVDDELNNALLSPNSLTGQALGLLSDRSLNFSDSAASYGFGTFVKEKLLPGARDLFDKAKTLFPKIADRLTGAISKLASVLTPERVEKVMAIVGDLAGDPGLKDSAVNLAKALKEIDDVAQKIDKTRKEKGELDAAGEVVKMLLAGKLAELQGGDASDIEKVTDKIEVEGK